MKLHPFVASTESSLCTFTHDGETCGRTKGGLMHVVDRPVINPLPPAEERSFMAGATPEALVVWRAHTEAVKGLLRSKNAYGTAWRDQGYMGNIGRVLSKASRLRNLCWRDATGEVVESQDGNRDYETVIDTLKDLSALCAFAIANLEDGNRWGNQ